MRCGNCQFPCKAAGQFTEEGAVPEEEVVVVKVVETEFGRADPSPETDSGLDPDGDSEPELGEGVGVDVELPAEAV